MFRAISILCMIGTFGMIAFPNRVMAWLNVMTGQEFRYFIVLLVLWLFAPVFFALADLESLRKKENARADREAYQNRVEQTRRRIIH